MTLEQRMYRDPLTVLLDEEARTCRGCSHEHQATVFGNQMTICIKKMSNGKRRDHGKRCKDYATKGTK